MLAAILAAATLGSCTVGGDSCEIEPFPSASANGLGAGSQPFEGPVDGQLGACPGWVEYAGALYIDSRTNRGLYDVWTLTDTDLRQIGVATGATRVVGRLRDAAVFSIGTIDPLDAVAVYSVRGDIVVLTASTRSFPPALCPYFKNPPLEEGLCPPDTSSPPIESSR